MEDIRDSFVEKINEGSYSGIIIPIVDQILQEYPELFFQQDNAKGHASKFTQPVLEAIDVKPMKWPANSPDLNPIETIWDWMKDYIEQKYPDYHTYYKRLGEAVLEAWESIPKERIQALIRGMDERCIEVILAEGGPTKYWINTVKLTIFGPFC
jgi:hypothetical protein